jgi:hypothetical protein
MHIWYQDSGILIADLPDEEKQLESLTARYETVEIRPVGSSAPRQPVNENTGGNAALLDLCASNLAWYVVRMRPFLIHLLQHLTGESIASIIHQPANLFYSRTHVDLRLALEQISIPLRRAGLDQSPGWLPVYGYIVTIYFD